MSIDGNGLNIDRYLFGSGYSIGLSLSSCNSLSLHWGDCADMVALQRKFYKQKSKFQFQLMGLRKDMEWVRTKEVHIRSDDNCIFTMTLMDIFEMLLKQSHTVSVVAFSPDTMVSVNGVDGPYRPFVAHDWFSYHSFQAYVYQRLLIGKLNVRKFRLRTDVVLSCLLDDNDKFEIRLKQLSNLGFLFYCKNGDDYHQISQASKFYVQINLDDLIGLQHCVSVNDVRSCVSGLEQELFTSDKEEHLIEVDLSAIAFDERQLASREYIFIPYCAFKAQDNKDVGISTMVNKLLGNLEVAIRDMVDKYYGEHGLEDVE